MYVTSPADGPNSGQYSARRSEVAVMRPEQYSRDKGYFVFIILHTCCFRALRSRSRVWSCPELDIFREKDAEASQIWMSHFHPHHLEGFCAIFHEYGGKYPVIIMWHLVGVALLPAMAQKLYGMLNFLFVQLLISVLVIQEVGPRTCLSTQLY